jgi:hypothetical protein
MPVLQRRCSCAFAFLALSLSAACQDTSPAITAVNREIGVSFSPSLIAYGEYDPNWLDGEHGWVNGGGFKTSVPFETLKTQWLAEATYQYDDGTSNHTSTTTTPYAAGFITNDIFFGIGPTFAPTSLFSLTPETYAEYREWHRGLPHNELDFIEHYTFWAPGVGVRAAYDPVGHFVVTARGGVAYSLFPRWLEAGMPLRPSKCHHTHFLSVRMMSGWQVLVLTTQSVTEFTLSPGSIIPASALAEAHTHRRGRCC